MSEQREVYRLGPGFSVNDLNRLLGRIAQRLDQMEGYRGTPSFKNDIDMNWHQAERAGVPNDPTDLARKDQTTSADHLTDFDDPHHTTAEQVEFTPAGNLSAETVQAAVEELDAEKSDTGHGHASLTFTGFWKVLAADDGTTVLHGAGNV